MHSKDYLFGYYVEIGSQEVSVSTNDMTHNVSSTSPCWLRAGAPETFLSKVNNSGFPNIGTTTNCYFHCTDEEMEF